jgi:hypothetical protein
MRNEQARNCAPLNSVFSREAEFGFATEVLRDDLLGWQFAPSSAPTRFDPASAQFTGKGRGFHASQGRNLLNRLASRVQFDRVVKVSRINSSAHVYNLHTDEGWYSSNNHIVSNCDCGVEPLDSGAQRFQALDGSYRVIDPKALEQTHASVKAFLGVEDRAGADVGLGKLSAKGADLKDYTDILVVHHHGEIGPVLGIRGQNFDGPRSVNN